MSQLDKLINKLEYEQDNDDDYDVSDDRLNAIFGDEDDTPRFDDDELAPMDRRLLTLYLQATNGIGMGMQMENIPIKNRLFEKKQNERFTVSSVSMQGYRDFMEDSLLIDFKLQKHPNCSVFGVFDGHGGHLTSEFVKNELLSILEECKDFDDESEIEKCIKELDQKWIAFEIYFFDKLEKEAIKKDKEEKVAIEHFTQDSDDDQNNDDSDHKSDNKQQKQDAFGMDSFPSNQKGTVGTTVVFAIVRYNKSDKNYTIITVNLGDSRAILLSKQTPGNIDNASYRLLELTKDHKPDNVEERERIEKAGGHVQYSRVDGDLALSRAIGDTRFKQNRKLPCEEQKISCVPDITYQTAKYGDILMLYCDGIVECKSNQDIFEYILPKLDNLEKSSHQKKSKKLSISSHLTKSEMNYFANKLALSLQNENELKPLDKLLFDLTDYVLDTGSKDNMTAMIVKIEKNTGKNEKRESKIWCPEPYNKHQTILEQCQENDENEPLDNMQIKKWQKLFESDCTNTGFDLSDKYEKALLYKVLYINDLIYVLQSEKEIQDHITEQNKLLLNLSEETKMNGKSPNTPKSKKSKNKKNKKRKLSDVATNNNNLPQSPGSPSNIKKRKVK